MPKNIYVVRHGPDWAVRSENSKRPARVVSTQREAIDIATPMLRIKDVKKYLLHWKKEHHIMNISSECHLQRNVIGKKLNIMTIIQSYT